MKKVLNRKFGVVFYDRALGFCHHRLTHASLSVSKKVILLCMVLFCSEINISLNAPVSKSIRLSSQYTFTYNNKPLGSAYNLSANRNIISEVFPHSYILAEIPEMIFLTHQRNAPRPLVPDERALVPFSLRLSPLMPHGPPDYQTESNPAQIFHGKALPRSVAGVFFPKSNTLKENLVNFSNLSSSYRRAFFV